MLPDEFVSSKVLLFAVAMALLRLMLAVAPCTKKEASLAIIVALLYCNVLAAPPLLKRKPMPPFPEAVTLVPAIVTLPPF